MTRIWRILFFPNQVFTELRENASSSTPLALLLSCGALCMALIAYVEGVDFNVSELERLQVETEQEGIARGTTRATDAIVGSVLFVIGMVVGLLTLGTYYWIAGKSFQFETSWPRWFAFTCWSAIPVIFWSIATFALVSFFGVEYKNGFAPLTWLGINQPWAALLNVAVVWTIFISIQGLRCWGSQRLSTSTIIVLVPYVLYILIGSFYMTTMAVGS